MKRKPKLKYVKFQISKGKLYGYFNTGCKQNGKLIWTALPPYNSPGFWDSYNTMMGHRTRRSSALPTVKDLVARYEAADEFAALKPGSRKLYRLTMDKVVANFGDFPLDDVTRGRVADVLPGLKGNATRNIFLAVLKVLFRFARINEMTNADPAKDFVRFKTGEHEPWPAELIEAALTCDDARVRLAVHLLYYTGQRIGDVCKMRWDSIRGNRVSVVKDMSVRGSRLNIVQEKTDKHLSIFLHKDLAKELDSVERTGETIITSITGTQLGTNALRNNIQAFAEGLGFEVVPHGLRKNAVNSLLEAGCLPQEVAAVTGQSMAMIEHYAKRVNQPLLGDSAILKLERSTV
ncbi:tyrosine-type recombinase/integrase [Novosphingobium rosa]|uniref:tyrosine-type recombinase/integrase n=1 Tax=Novosphingobium rosa TaxID=76978 RepID=UPI00082D8EE6|nr:tyrosine-type recombinase/integrase [Novosphingobium rosa]